MKLNINLATRPYEDVRRFAAISTGVLAVLLVSAALLCLLVYKRWHDYREVSRAISVERNVLNELDTKQAQGLAILNRPENRDVREHSDFLNQLIRRKEVSWTRIFINLEKMMPAHLRVLSVQPALKDDKMIVSMQLGGDSRERVTELVRRMESSRTFRNTQVVSETDNQLNSGSPDLMTFSVTAEYVPGSEIPNQPVAAASGGL